jgi:hypothetical protein
LSHMQVSAPWFSTRAIWASTAIVTVLISRPTWVFRFVIFLCVSYWIPMSHQVSRFRLFCYISILQSWC